MTPGVVLLDISLSQGLTNFMKCAITISQYQIYMHKQCVCTFTHAFFSGSNQETRNSEKNESLPLQQGGICHLFLEEKGKSNKLISKTRNKQKQRF